MTTVIRQGLPWDLEWHDRDGHFRIQGQTLFLTSRIERKPEGILEVRARFNCEAPRPQGGASRIRIKRHLLRSRPKSKGQRAMLREAGEPYGWARRSLIS